MFWLRRSEWDKINSSPQTVLSNLKSGCLQVKDAPQLVYEAAFTYALEMGSLDDYDKVSAVVLKANLTSADDMNEIINEQFAEHTKENEKRTSAKRNFAAADAWEGDSRTKRTKTDHQEKGIRRREHNAMFLRDIPKPVDIGRVVGLLKTVRHPFCRFHTNRKIGDVVDVKVCEEAATALVYLELNCQIGLTSQWLDRSLTLDIPEAQKALQPILGGHSSIENAAGSVLYVTNFPPTLDTSALQALFENVGSSMSLIDADQ
jgi:hypothetical protein